MTVNSNEALLAVSAQPPVSDAIEANSVFFQLFSCGVMQFWCGANLDLVVLSVGYCTDATRTEGSVQESFEVDKAIAEDQLGCLLAVVFNDFNPEAVAAASIGQIHSATLTDEARTPVAVKVQYPTVERYCRMDVRTIEFILRCQGMGRK